MVVLGLRYRDQTNRNRPSSKRFIPILNSKKKKELRNWKHSCLNQYTLCLKMRLMTTIVLQMRMNLMRLIQIMKVPRSISWPSRRFFIFDIMQYIQ